LTSDRQEGTLDAFVAGLYGRLDWRDKSNELEEAVVDEWPEVGEGLRISRASRPIRASLSGSGSVSFAVFDSRESARRVVAELPAGRFVHVGSTPGRRSARSTVRTAGDGGSR